MQVFYFKRGGTLPVLDYVLLVETDGGPVPVQLDLTGAVVTFRFRPASGGAVVSLPGSVASNETKALRCQMHEAAFADVDEPTVFDYEVEVVLQDGNRLTSPTLGYEQAMIYPPLE